MKEAQSPIHEYPNDTQKALEPDLLDCTIKPLGLMDMPLEIFQMILVEMVKGRTVKRALRLRLVSSKYHYNKYFRYQCLSINIIHC